MILTGLLLMLLAVPLLCTVGASLATVGAILWILGALRRAVGPRPHYS